MTALYRARRHPPTSVRQIPAAAKRLRRQLAETPLIVAGKSPEMSESGERRNLGNGSSPPSGSAKFGPYQLQATRSQIAHRRRSAEVAESHLQRPRAYTCDGGEIVKCDRVPDVPIDIFLDMPHKERRG